MAEESSRGGGTASHSSRRFTQEWRGNGEIHSWEVPTAFGMKFSAGGGSTWPSLAGSLHPPPPPHHMCSAGQLHTPGSSLYNSHPLHTFAQATPSAGNKLPPLSTGPVSFTLPSLAQSHSWEACLHLPGGARCLRSALYHLGSRALTSSHLPDQDAVWHLFLTSDTKPCLRYSLNKGSFLTN